MNPSRSSFRLASLLTGFLACQLAAQETKPQLVTTNYSDAKMTPCPATICAAPTGEVFVGVDMQGSLGKEEGYGSIVRLIDKDNDGVADEHTVFAKLDNPRGVISVGKKLFVLHNTFKDGKVENQHLSVLTDEDWDGVADGPPKFLVRNIGNPPHLRGRGTDHSTNGIRLAIDGWIYISIGDFGFIDATGTDGTKLSMLGGGVVRVRPDGTGLETFIHGTRNVYDVAIDPFMNVYSRENTNDGVGWWIRFSHYIQSGEYGYPSLYMNFAHDMIPALSEHGGGSGTGALYLNEPSWPAPYNKQPLMADWGRRKIYIHEVTPNGASFTNVEKVFLSPGQVSDLDVDGSGRMYIADWQGAGYKGNKDKGKVDRVVPEGWEYIPYPSIQKATEKELLERLASDSAVAQVDAQQEILRRDEIGYIALMAAAMDKSKSLTGRVAAVYTLAQLDGPGIHKLLADLAKDDDIREHAIRCMADQKSVAAKADIQLLASALKDPNPRVQVAAAIALGRTGKKEAAPALLTVAAPPKGSTAPIEIPKSKEIKLLRDAVPLDVDISKFETLYLVVNEGKEKKKDHAAWLEPTLHTAGGKTIDLTKEEFTVITEGDKGRFKTRTNKSVDNKPLLNVSKKEVNGIGTHGTSILEFKLPPGVVRFTATGRLTDGAKGGGAVSFSVLDSIEGVGAGGKPHSTPRPDGILPHVARQSLVSLNAVGASLEALRSNDLKLQAAALDTLKFIHSEEVVEGLLKSAKASDNKDFQQMVAYTLIRLHHKEKDYDGKSWWSTRPDPTGPVYYPTPWSGTDKITAYLKEYLETLDEAGKARTLAEMQRNRAYVKGLVEPKRKGRKQETIKDIAIEDIIIRVTNPKAKGYKKPNVKNGKKVITKIGCIACHNVEPGQPVKGPDLTQMGNRNKAELAEAIITPGTSIAESWVSVTTKEGAPIMGTLVKKDDFQIVLHEITGLPKEIDTDEVKKIEPGPNTMPYHLCDQLTLQEFSDLIAYIQSMDAIQID